MRGRPSNTFSWTAVERRQLDIVRSRLDRIRCHPLELRSLSESAQITLATLTRIADGRMPQRRTLVKLVKALQI